MKRVEKDSEDGEEILASFWEELTRQSGRTKTILCLFDAHYSARRGFLA